MQNTTRNREVSHEEPAEPLVPGSVDGRPIHALVIDDEAVIRSMVCACLIKAGWVVYEADSGERGLERYEEVNPDLIVLDLLMPGRDGFEICREFRARGANNVPILIMTGLEDESAVHRAYDSGATDFVSKPIDYTVLPYRLRWILEASRSMARLKESERRLRKAQEVARLGSWELQRVGGALSVSDEALRIFGVPKEDFDGKHTTLLRQVHPKDRLKVNRMFSSALDGIPLSLEHRIVDGVDHVRHVRQEVETPSGDQRGAVVTGTIQDVTEVRRAQRQLFQLHYFDKTTGLANQDYVERHIARAAPLRQGVRLAVMAVQLQNLKRVQGSFGREAAEKTLTMTADRLVTLVQQGVGDADEASRSTQRLDLVARFGSAEFGVLREIDDSDAEIASFASKTRERLTEVLVIDGRRFVPEVKIGIAVYDPAEESMDFQGAVDNARGAHLLGSESESIHFHSSKLSEQMADSFRIESDLRFALEREQFRVHYQPKVDLETGSVSGVEVLVRWQHPERGLVPPSDFVPLAEKSGLILEIGEWVLGQALLDLQIHQQALPSLRLAINLSTRQFYDLELIHRIQGLLDDGGLPASQIELEVTEHALLEDRRLSEVILGQLKCLGVHLALDDFGTGFSSMSFLKDFPFDIVKFDRSFVREIVESHYSRALVASLVELSQCLGKKVVAEGIETEEELEVVREVKCDESQGYYFCKPMPIEELVAWITERAADRAESKVAVGG